MPLQPLYGEKSWGSHGAFEIDIKVACPLPSLEVDSILEAARKAAHDIKSAVMGEVIKNDPECKEQTRRNREGLLGAFAPGSYSFVREVPNGYCSDYCCKHLPWFEVATKVGIIKIGWRKRVIQIDWTQTEGTRTADAIFPDEDVTKERHMIHAWSLADAKRYIEAIVKSAE